MSDNHPEFTDREKMLIEAAASKAVQDFRNGIYQEVGKTIVSKFFIIIGAAVVAVASWLHFGDFMPKG